MDENRATCLDCDRDLEPGSRYFARRVRFANGYTCAECSDTFRAVQDKLSSPDDVDRSKAFFVGNTGGYTGAGG